MKKRKPGPRSMDETISLRLAFIGFLSMLLATVLTMVMYHRAFDKQVIQDLKVTAANLAQSYSYLPADNELDGFTQGELRITLVAPDGTVLFESNATGQLENHLTRPEVQQALQTGSGQDRRTSSTLGYNTYYYALLLPDGNVLRVARDAANLYAIYNEALPAVVVCCVCVLFFAVLLSLLLTRQLVRPIEHMAQNLDEIDQNVPYKELVPFAQAIKDDRLLRDSNEKIRQEFTANVSHELKTPLTSISGYAELIENGMAKPDDVPVFAGKIRTESARLLTLIRDIIQLTELDSPPATPQFATIDLHTVAKECASRLTLNAQKAYVTLRVQGDSQLVRGDMALLQELCYNLCDNAIRYNRPGGTVTLSTFLRGGCPCLQVQDTGIGIPAAAQQRVFERFYRVDKSRSRETGGTGLGLAIVKHCAALHSAQIQLDSTPGSGTTITVLFPAKT